MACIYIYIYIHNYYIHIIIYPYLCCTNGMFYSGSVGLINCMQSVTIKSHRIAHNALRIYTILLKMSLNSSFKHFAHLSGKPSADVH